MAKIKFPPINGLSRVLVLFLLTLLMTTGISYSQPCEVTSGGDAGIDTLRQAILDANAGDCDDNGVQRIIIDPGLEITITSTLPSITVDSALDGPLVIEGQDAVLNGPADERCMQINAANDPIVTIFDLTFMNIMVKITTRNDLKLFYKCCRVGLKTI